MNLADPALVDVARNVAQAFNTGFALGVLTGCAASLMVWLLLRKH